MSKETKKDQSKVKEIIDLFQNHPIKGAELTKRAYYRAFFEGHHYVVRDRIKNELYVVKPKKDTKHRSKINLIASNVDISVSKILKENPLPVGVPTGLSEKDAASARVASKFFQHAFERADQSIIEKCYSALTYANVYGTGWMYINWNEDFYVNKDMGDYEIKVFDDFQVMCDPTGTNYFDYKWILHRHMKDKKDIEYIYPHLKGKLKTWTDNDMDSERNKFNPQDYMGKHNVSNVYKDKVLVWEYWEMPTKHNKKGELIVIINEKELAERKENGNPFAKYYPYSNPFVPFYWKKLADKPLGDSAVADQIPIIKDLNAMISYSMETMRKVGGAKVMLPKGSGIKLVDFDDSIGQYIEYNDAGGTRPPFVMQGTSLPSGYSDVRNFLGGVLQDVSGNHEVSQGGTPQGSSRISGSALKLLIDSEFIRQSPVMRRYKISLKVIAEIIMRLIKDKYDDERKISIVGEGNEYELEVFKKSDLDGSFDIKIEIGSAFDSSPSARVEGLLNIWDRGILQAAEQGDPSAKKVLKSLEFGETDNIMLMEKLHKNKALWVVDMIKNKKEIPPISSEDNHEIHIEVLLTAMLSPEFYKNMKSEIQNAIQQRIDEHRNFILGRNQQAQQAAQMAQGGNQSGGQASEPPLPMQNAQMNMSMGGEGGVT